MCKIIRIKATNTLNNCHKFDVMIVPGGWGTRKEVANEKLIEFIKNRGINECGYVSSVCTGAFLLQKAGLLNHKQGTTDCGSLKRLKVFEDVDVVEKRFIKNDNGVWTSAGISSGIDMSLEFIKDIGGEDIASIVQMESEYYPADIVYGSAFKNNPESAVLFDTYVQTVISLCSPYHKPI